MTPVLQAACGVIIILLVVIIWLLRIVSGMWRR